MKLHYMKEDCIELLKENLGNPEIASKYYSEEDNSWMTKLCGKNPFVEFREVNEFSLASLESKGKAQLENCKIIYSNLSFLTPSQATDERIWAGLANGTFYKYVRERWGYDVKKYENATNAEGEICSRFFFQKGVANRHQFYRNTFSKCWWVGKAFFEGGANPYRKLDILGANDIASKIQEIFLTNTFSSNPVVLNGIVKCFEHYNAEGKGISTRTELRPTIQMLNAIGGVLVLDCLTSDEIAERMIEKIDEIRAGRKESLQATDDGVEEEDF